MFLQFPMAPFSSIFFKKSYFWTIHLSYILSALGVWIRVIAEKNVGLAIFGQSIVGAMSSISIAGCSVLANLWFEPKYQPAAVAIASTSYLLGAAFGLVISPYYTNIFDLLILQACYTSVGALLNIFLSRNKHKEKDEDIDFKGQLNMTFQDSYLIALIFLLSSALGIAYAIAGIIYELLRPNGISENQAGWIGFSMYIGGTIGGLVTSVLIHKTKNFIQPIRIFILLSIGGCLLWALLKDHFPSNIVGGTACGFGLFGLMPLGIQAIVDQNKYVSEAISTNIIYFIAQWISVIYTYPLMYFYDLTGISGLWLIVIITVIGLAPLIYLYRKTLIEENKKGTETIYVTMNSFHN